MVMEEEALDLFVDCWSCRRRIDVDAEVTYALGEDDVLCFECALDRGARYDVDEDRWIEEPRVDDVMASEGERPAWGH